MNLVIKKGRTLHDTIGIDTDRHEALINFVSDVINECGRKNKDNAYVYVNDERWSTLLELIKDFVNSNEEFTYCVFVAGTFWGVKNAENEVTDNQA